MTRNKILPNEPPRHVLKKVVFTLPNGIERVEFIDSDKSNVDPWAWEKFMAEYLKHHCGSEKKNDRRT